MSERITPNTNSVKDRIDPAILEQLYALESPAEDSVGTVDEQATQTPDKPRMTPAIQEALQQFTLDSRVRGKDAHTEALEEYRNRDEADYVDHVYGLATSENPEVTDEAKANAQRLVDRENRRADRQEAKDATLEYLDAQRRLLGRYAIAGAMKAVNIGLGAAKIGYGKVENKVRTKAFELDGKHTNKRVKRSYDKQVAALEKEAMKTNAKLEKQGVKDSKRAARYDRAFERSMKRKETAEKLLGTLERGAASAARTKRRLGAFAAKMEAVGKGQWPETPQPTSGEPSNDSLKPTDTETDEVVYDISSLPPR